MNKREFLRTSAGAGLGLLLGESVWARFADVPADELASDEAFWNAIRAKYRLKPDYINLESGYYSIQATPVLEAFIRKVREKIPALWPIYGDWRMTDDADIMKLNHTGTHPVHTDLAIADAVAFHELIGIRRKEARLRYLQTYWTDKVRKLPNVIMNTPSDPARTCAIANVGVHPSPVLD